MRLSELPARAGLAAVAAALGLGALPARAAEAVAVAAPFELSDPARIDAGRKRFGATCAAYCHGSGGTGGKAPAFRGRGAEFVPAEAFKVISEGRRGADIMPPWGTAFTPEQIWELVAYLQFLAGQAAP